MQVVEKIITIDSRWFSPERDVTRTKGLHLSHILDYIEFLEGKREEFGGVISAVGNNYAAGGFMWERALANLIELDEQELWEWIFGRTMSEPSNPEVVRPGEQCIDIGECTNKENHVETHQSGCHVFQLGRGLVLCPVCKGLGRLHVYMTPDGYHITDECLEEWKYTSKSANTPITHAKFRRWISFQIPAYLKALGLRTCRLRVYFSRGDYTTGAPIWKEFVLTYGQHEIDDTWDTIAQHALLMFQKGIVK